MLEQIVVPVALLLSAADGCHRSPSHSAAPASAASSSAPAVERVTVGKPIVKTLKLTTTQPGRIEAVGSSAEVRKRSGAVTKVIDAKGLLAQHPRRGGTLVRGAPADVMLIDRPLSTAGQSVQRDTEIVLAIESGRIVTDRDALAR